MKLKKTLAMLSAITMMASGTVGYFPAFSSAQNTVTADAADITPQTVKIAAAETTEDGWSYTVDNDQVTITGYSGDQTAVKVPEKIADKPVVAIGNKAFAGNTAMTSIDLGSVQRIGYQVFKECIGLKEVTIPKTVTETGTWYSSEKGALCGSSVETVTFEEGIANIPAYVCYGATSVKNVILPEKEDTIDGYAIGNDAFRDTSIASVTLPKSLTAIDNWAFAGCALLTEINIPDNVTRIGDDTFSGCKRLKNIQIGKSVTEIGCKAFQDCANLAEIDLKNVQKIGYQAFSGCIALTEITIPKTVTETGTWYSSEKGALCGSSVETVTFEEGIANIPAYVCYGASSVKNVILPEKEDTIDGYAIGNDAFRDTSIASVTLPKSLTAINDWAFAGCALLTEINVPDNVTRIGDDAFSGCKRLKNIKLGASVTEIGCKAFEECISLSEIDLKSVQKIGYQAFSGCTSLKEITFPKTVTEAGTWYSSEKGALCGSSVETVTFEEGIANIPAYVCYGATSVKNVILPEKEDTVDGYVIGNDAFRDTSISSVTFPKSLTAINNWAFAGCALLTEINIPDNVTRIGDDTFSGCKRLKNIKLGTSVTEIGCKAFEDCVSLSEIDLKNVQKIGYQAFSGCTSLKEITFPKTVTEAGTWYSSEKGALCGSSVETVTFEEGIANIPAFVCYGATSVKNVILPEKEDTVDGYVIGNDAFRDTSISSVTLPKSLTAINNWAFAGCALLTEINIPDNVTRIGEDAFSGCKRLRNVHLSKSLTDIGCKAFQDCINLSEIDLKNVQKIGYQAFSGCSMLKEITIPKTVTEAGTWYSSEKGALCGSSVETVTFANGIEKVPDYICWDSGNLKTVYIPESCASIGAAAFRDCAKLTAIVSDRATFLFQSTSFMGCDKLNDSRLTVFDLNCTSLTANTDQASVNGIINYTLRYKLMPSLAGNVTDRKMVIKIPEQLTLLMDSVQSENLEIDGEQINGGEIPVNADEGVLRFSVRTTESGNYNISASMKFKYNNSDWDQPIGSLDVECPNLTLAVPETVNELTANVYGMAQKGQSVSVYVNDKLAGTITANAFTGRYQGAVKLPADTKNGESVEIYAKAGDNVSETVKTVYAAEKPVVKQVIFRYNQHSDHSNTLDITDVLIRGTSPVVTFNPAYPTSYEITATNNEKIDRMFVTSTKAGSDKYIEAFYDAESGKWIANGYFDPNNRSYVPGALNISIMEKKTTVLDENYDYAADSKFASVPEGFQENSSVEVVKQTDNSVLSNVKVSDGTNSETFQMYSSETSDGIYINGTFVQKQEIVKNPEKYGFKSTGTQTITDGKKADYYVRVANNEDVAATILLESGEAVGTLGDIWSGATILEIMEGDAANNPVVKFANNFITESASECLELMFGSGYSNISTGLSFGSDILTYAGQMKLANGDTEYEVLSTVLFGLKCFNNFGGTELLLGMCGIEPPFSTMIKAGIDLLLDYADDWLVDWMKSGRHFFGSGHIRFIIDPSGIICEAVLGNTVEGATVTIYYQNEETGEAVKWNAEDYDQLNPLLTDEDGQYLWDVPEGKWKVVCTKDGYNTVESEWLDVPPVQTDINLMITSKEAPALTAATLTKDGLTVQFSKFVDISTVSETALILNGFEGNVTITPQLLNEGDLYADTFVLTGDYTDALKSVTVTKNILSYAGTAAAEGTLEIKDNRFEMGDANRDYAINLKDVTLIRRYIAGGWDAEIVNTALADVNGDGVVNLKDVTLLRRYIAGGWDVTFTSAS